MSMKVKTASIATHHLKNDGSIPNSRFPLLIYRGVLDLPRNDPASAIEELIHSHQWGNDWRNGIYSFHHYHSTAHEVLLVYSGSARVHLGGEKGVIETIKVGDVVLIPAGVGHKNLGSGDDFGVVGAYPTGQEWDLCYGKPGERPRTDHNIARVPLPDVDPVYGNNGPLLQHWQKPN
jgi:uncharacterized protein YjlB